MSSNTPPSCPNDGDYLIEDLANEQLKELFGDAALIQPFFIYSRTDEGDLQGLLELTRAEHELVEGILQHMRAPYAHIQVLKHHRMDALKQCLHPR